MSRLFPHTSFSEDQPLSKTLLTSHVLYRGFQTGAILSPFYTLPIYYLSLSKYTKNETLPRPQFLPLLLRNAARGAILGTGLMVFGTVGRMWGRSELEWKDRAWRLLENEGQMQVDDLSLAGSLIGVLAGLGVARRGSVLMPRVGKGLVIGSLAVGNAVGVAAYMGWRYGVKGGKF